MNHNNMLFDAQRKMNQMPPGGLASMLGGGSMSTTEEARMALFNSLAADSQAQTLLLNNRNLTFTSQDAAQRSVMEVLARHNTTGDNNATGTNSFEDELAETKRKLEQAAQEPEAKKQRLINELTGITDKSSLDGPDPVAPSEEGTSFFNDSDVLSGRGGGTNVHPGNRHFRELINLHRRAYLKARKNDKPAISRAIVRAVRENNGRFLKRDEKSGLWFEIGDDAAREKTSQALRQRAPEMRKILFESEREQARQEAEEQLRQHQQLIASGIGNGLGGSMGGQQLQAPVSSNSSASDIMQANIMNSMNFQNQQSQGGMFNPLLAMQGLNKNSGLPGIGSQQMGQPSSSSDPYSQMSQNLMAAALLGNNGSNRFGGTNGAA